MLTDSTYVAKTIFLEAEARGGTLSIPYAPGNITQELGLPVERWVEWDEESYDCGDGADKKIFDQAVTFLVSNSYMTYPNPNSGTLVLIVAAQRPVHCTHAPWEDSPKESLWANAIAFIHSSELGELIKALDDPPPEPHPAPSAQSNAASKIDPEVERIATALYYEAEAARARGEKISIPEQGTLKLELTGIQIDATSSALEKAIAFLQHRNHIGTSSWPHEHRKEILLRGEPRDMDDWNLPPWEEHQRRTEWDEKYPPLRM